MSDENNWLVSMAGIGLVSAVLAKINKGKKYMEKDIIDGQIGSVGSYDLEFKQGKLSFVLKAGAVGVHGVVGIELEADAVIDAISKAIPGQIDDAIFGVLKAALKSV